MRRRKHLSILVGRGLKALVMAAVSLASTPTLAYSVTVRTTLDPVHDGFVQYSGEAAELNLTYIHRLTEIARTDLKMSVADFVPTTMSASESETRVARQIVGHSLERWFENSPWARANISETIKAVEAPLNRGLRVTDQNGVTHRLQMGVKAARALASLSYTGWVNATLAYQVTSQTLGLEISRQLARGQKLILSHVADTNESRQIVAYQFEW